MNVNDLRKDKPSRALSLMKNSSKEIISFQRLARMCGCCSSCCWTEVIELKFMVETCNSHTFYISIFYESIGIVEFVAFSIGRGFTEL